MKRLSIIGIGAGDPDQLTFQAARAIAAADAFLLVDKGGAKHDLADLRRALIAEHGRAPYRIVEARDPERDRTAAAYTAAVEDWRSAARGSTSRSSAASWPTGRPARSWSGATRASTTAPSRRWRRSAPSSSTR